MHMYGMQDQSLEAFMHTLDSACLLDMPKLLACCEHHICADPKQRFGLKQLQLSRQFATTSALRVPEGLRMACQRMAGANERCLCQC